MANENGAEKLIERILAEARQDAEAVLQQADDQAGRLNGAAQAEADAIRTAAEAKGNKIREEILERCRTNAKLDARKHILAAKRGLMEEAFDLAERRLEEMSGKERDDVLRGMLQRECQGGETILPAPKDVEAMAALIAVVNAGFASENKAALTLGPAEPSLKGGFLVRAQGYEKNCSFTALMRELRESKQTDVADILFS